MIFTQRVAFWFVLVLAALGTARPAAAQSSAEYAWKALPAYEYGQDMAPLLAIDRMVIEAMSTPPARAACAARLGSLLESSSTTLAARQYICHQLRQIGTAAEVPVLARLLADPKLAEPAREALEAISGEASLQALRDALPQSTGPLRVGLINSLGARRDGQAVPALQKLAGDADPALAAAALWALGNIADREAFAFLQAKAQETGVPTPRQLAVPLLRCAQSQAAAQPQPARAALELLAQTGQPAGVRRAALGRLFGLQAGDRTATILGWLADADADRRLIAAAHLPSVSDEQLDQAAARLGQLPEASQRSLIEVLATRRGQQALPWVLSLVKSEKPEQRLAGLRCLGNIGDASAIPLLMETLPAGGELTVAAQQALAALPRQEVGPALLDALKGRPEIRPAVIEVLKTLRYYEAIDPLIELAAQSAPAVYGPALDGLRGIADPDEHDIPRLVQLLRRTPRGEHRDEVEKTLLIVCDKSPAGADRAAPVLTALAKATATDAPECLPLLGRLGGPQALARIEAGLADPRPEVQEAAVRGLCNWPTAEVADRLLGLAGKSDNANFRRWALRAYVRVVSLKSERPDEQTLAMLQNAMKLCQQAEDEQLILERASTIRTLDSVLWIASYLDDPQRNQAACRAIVELAHHRFLRQPNMDRFGPILDKVSTISQDPAVVERAKRYRLGL